jgi:uncharacterized protein with PCYCGC motif
VNTHKILLLCWLLPMSVIPFALFADRAPLQAPESQRPLAFHEHPPTEPLEPTLNAEGFRYNRPAFVAYALAARVSETLYQVPCYCHCNREAGHKSLLDCFTSKHGAMCTICQKETIFCYWKQGKGKTPVQIREAMAKGEASRLNLNRYVDRFYKEIAEATQ